VAVFSGAYSGRLFTDMNTGSSGADADESLVYFLGTKFQQFTPTQQTNRNYPPGSATITAGPYMEFPGSTMTRDTDGDGWAELVDVWGSPYCYVPSSEYLNDDGTYRRGTILSSTVNPVPGTTALTWNDFFKQSTFQIMSAGPDLTWQGAPVTSGHLGTLGDDLNNW